jgi:hypothetical protein
MIKRLSISAIIFSSITLNLLAATASQAFPTWSQSIMRPGTSIVKGSGLTSQNRCFNLVFSKDGVLRLYNNDKKELIWNSGTSNPNVTKAKFQADGNFVLYTQGEKEAVWNSNTSGSDGTKLILQNDGNLVIYTKSGRTAAWATNTSDSSYENKSKCKI